MSREIKFRDKREDDNEWIYGDLIQYLNGVISIYDHSLGWLDRAERVNPKTVGQYTGLKDKNRDDTEVYQGDIYEWCGLTFPITIDDYHGYRFMFGKDQLCRAYIQNGKYIGNIHETNSPS